MKELLEKITALEKQIATAEGAKKAELEAELAKVREELSEKSKRMEELEKENAVLKEAKIDSELLAMVAEGKLREDQKAIARSLMVAGQDKAVKELFSKADPRMASTKKPDNVKVVSGAGAAPEKGLVIPYSEFEMKSQAERVAIIAEMENPKATRKIVIADDFTGRSRGASTPFDKQMAEHQFEKNADGMIEFDVSYTAGVSQTLSGSNFLPKVWESKVIYDLGNQNFGFSALALQATFASAYQIQWNVVGTLAAQGTNVHQGTITGTTSMVITPVTMNPQWYGNKVIWEGNINDWSVSNVKDNVIYPALLRDYNVTMDTEAINVLLAASATLSANTMQGGTYGRGTTTMIGSVGTFNDNGVFNTTVALAAKAILAGQGAARFGNDYIVMASPEQLYSAVAGTGWLGVMQYADSTRLISGEYGRWMGIRFVENAAIRKVTGTAMETAAGTGTNYTAIMLGAQALGKGFDIDFQLTFYPDFAFDAGRFKSMQWNSRGRFARLKVNEVVPIRTTFAQVVSA
jgi:N4-gp56 family major capsid protein